MNRVLIARMNADRSSTEEFNRWYNGAHMKQASSIPGYGPNHRRYQAQAFTPGNSHWPYRPHPEYTAIYEIKPETDLLRAINSDEYRAWSGDFLAQWRDRTSNEVSVLCDQVMGADTPISSDTVIIAQMNVPAEAGDEFVQWYSREHAPRAESIPHLGNDHRLFRSLELEGKYWHYRPNPQFTAIHEIRSGADIDTMLASPEFQDWIRALTNRGTATDDYEIVTICRRIY